LIPAGLDPNKISGLGVDFELLVQFTCPEYATRAIALHDAEVD